MPVMGAFNLAADCWILQVRNLHLAMQLLMPIITAEIHRFVICFQYHDPGYSFDWVEETLRCNNFI